MCMSALLAFMWHCAWCPRRSEEGIGSPWTRVTEIETAICVLGIEPWSLAKATTVLTAESTLQQGRYLDDFVSKMTRP